MFGQRSTIFDDRQQRVPLLTASAAKGDQELAELLARFAETAQPGYERVRWEHLLWILLFIAIVVSATLIASAFPVIPSWAFGAIWPAMFVTLGAAMASRTRARHAQRLVEGLLHIGRCPCCGYRLAGLPQESDATVVCPECSAAWNFERVGATTLPLTIPRSPDDVPGDIPPLASRWYRWIGRMPTILDARERPLPLVNLWARTFRQSLTEPEYVALRRDISDSTLLRRLVMAGIALLFSFLFFGMVAMTLVRPGFGVLTRVSTLFIALMAIAYLIATWRIWSGRSRITARPTRDVLVRHRLCASCGTPLQSESTEVDPLTCAKCRAQWSYVRR